MWERMTADEARRTAREEEQFALARRRRGRDEQFWSRRAAESAAARAWAIAVECLAHAGDLNEAQRSVGVKLAAGWRGTLDELVAVARDLASGL